MADPKPQQCGELLGSAQQLVALSFDLVGSEKDRLPERIAKALQSAEVQKAIADALETEAKKLQTKLAKEDKLSVEDGNLFAMRAGKKAASAVTDNIFKDIKAAPAYKEVAQQAKQVLTDFKCSPVGVWVDENRTVLYIVGSVLALAGGAALYYFKSGDAVAKFAEITTDPIRLGTIDFKFGVEKFEPSSRTVAVAVQASRKWSAVSADLKIAGMAQGADWGGSVDGKVIVALSPRWSLMGSAKLDLTSVSNTPEARRIALGAGNAAYLKYQSVAALKFDGEKLDMEFRAVVENGVLGSSANIGYRETVSGFNIRASAAAQADTNGVYSATGNLELRF